MGRWKMGAQGGYWDAMDSGPDQYTPTAEQTAVPQMAPKPMPAGDPGMVSGPATASPESPMIGGGGVVGPRRGPIVLQPGEGGTWGHNQPGNQPMSIEAILEFLRSYYGNGAQQPPNDTLKPLPPQASPIATAATGKLGGAMPPVPTPKKGGIFGTMLGAMGLGR